MLYLLLLWQMWYSLEVLKPSMKLGWPSALSTPVLTSSYFPLQPIEDQHLLCLVKNVSVQEHTRRKKKFSLISIHEIEVPFSEEKAVTYTSGLQSFLLDMVFLAAVIDFRKCLFSTFTKLLYSNTVWACMLDAARYY